LNLTFTVPTVDNTATCFLDVRLSLLRRSPLLERMFVRRSHGDHDHRSNTYISLHHDYDDYLCVYFYSQRYRDQYDHGPDYIDW
jgi:hypothetical protein